MAKQKVEFKIKIESYDSKTVDSTAQKIVSVAKSTDAVIYGPVPLPTHIDKITVLRAPHKFKKSREQFETRTHKRLIGIVKTTPTTMDKLDRLVLPANVNIEIKQVTNSK